MMGKTEVICPHCSKEKFKIETHKKTEEFKKIKGGIYHRPALFPVAENEWVEDPNKCMGVQCKCGKHFFLNGFGNPHVSFEMTNSLPEGNTFATYCGKCGRAFTSPDMQCPTCGSQF